MAQKILSFGHFDLEGGRSWAIRTGLTERGFAVELCRTERKGFFNKYADLLRGWRARTQKPDALYVPFLGHYLLPLAWVLAKASGIPVVFDALISLYETEVEDRRRITARHWFSREFGQDLEHYMYDGGYGPTNEKLQRYLQRLFPAESAAPIATLHDAVPAGAPAAPLA